MTADEAKALLAQHYGQSAASEITEAILAAERKRLVEVLTKMKKDAADFGFDGWPTALAWAIQRIEQPT